MIYASAYTYRATLWFDFVVPSPAERKWLRQKYPKYWDDMEAVWSRWLKRWRTVGPGAANELGVHGLRCQPLRFVSVAAKRRHST